VTSAGGPGHTAPNVGEQRTAKPDRLRRLPGRHDMLAAGGDRLPPVGRDGGQRWAWTMDRDRALAVRLSKLAENGNSGE
jgi:hypothetical protein